MHPSACARTSSKRQRGSSLVSVAWSVTALLSVTLLLRSSHALQTSSHKTSSKHTPLDLSFVPVPIPLTVAEPESTTRRFVNGLETPPTEFDLSVGRALDALRRDYPTILTKQLDYSIYSDDIHVVDPSGVTLHGVQTYKNSFRILQALIKVVYCPNRSGLTFRMCYDKARQNIRVHWNAHVLPRFSFTTMNRRKPLYVDGISVYELDKKTGLIVQHRIEHILMNNQPVRPEEGVFAALEQAHTMSVPSFAKQHMPVIAGGQGTASNNNNLMLEFRPWQDRSVSSLFAMVQEQDGGDGAAAALNPMDKYPDLDWQALESKNKSRQKFGLQPVTPEEFIELEAQVADLAQEQLIRQQQQLQAMKKAEAAAKPNFLQQLFGQVLQDTCESNFDCERPMVCCDFGLKKMCCASGLPVVNGPPQYATVPVPQGIEDEGYGYPPGRGPGDGAGNERLW